MAGVTDKMVGFKCTRDENGKYTCEPELFDLSIVANTEKKVPQEWINDERQRRDPGLHRLLLCPSFRARPACRQGGRPAPVRPPEACVCQVIFPEYKKNPTGFSPPDSFQ